MVIKGIWCTPAPIIKFIEKTSRKDIVPFPCIKLLTYRNYENNYKKVKYTSCNKENRNKQIIKKFLEKEELIRNNISRLTTNQSNLNRVYFRFLYHF